MAVLEDAAAIVRRAGLRQEYVAPVLPWLATALRSQAEATSPYQVARRAGPCCGGRRRTARRGWRIARFYQNNAPHALRERALVASLRGHDRRARRLLDAQPGRGRGPGRPLRARPQPVGAGPHRSARRPTRAAVERGRGRPPGPATRSLAAGTARPAPSRPPAPPACRWPTASRHSSTSAATSPPPPPRTRSSPPCGRRRPPCCGSNGVSSSTSATTSPDAGERPAVAAASTGGAAPSSGGRSTSGRPVVLSDAGRLRSGRQRGALRPAVGPVRPDLQRGPGRSPASTSPTARSPTSSATTRSSSSSSWPCWPGPPWSTWPAPRPASGRWPRTRATSSPSSTATSRSSTRARP